MTPPIAKRMPLTEHGLFYEERRMCSPEVTGLLEAVTLLSHSELGRNLSHNTPNYTSRIFNNEKDLSIRHRIFLNTLKRRASLDINQPRTMANDWGWDPAPVAISVCDTRDNSGLLYKSGQLDADVFVSSTGNVTGVYQGNLPHDSKFFETDTGAQKDLFEALGLSALVSADRGRPIALAPESITKLADFLINQVGGQIIPGLRDQIVEVSFAN